MPQAPSTGALVATEWPRHERVKDERALLQVFWYLYPTDRAETWHTQICYNYLGSKNTETENECSNQTQKNRKQAPGRHNIRSMPGPDPERTGIPLA